MGIGIIKSTNAGFFSNFRGTIYTFHKCNQLGVKPYVQWDGGLYYDVNKGPNCWEYYFEQIGDINDKDRINLSHDMSWNRKEITRERSNELIKQYVKIKPHIKDKIDSFWMDNFKPKDNVLGIHLRLTDKFNCTSHGEPVTGKPVSVNEYIKHAKIYVEKNNNAKIFLATDSVDDIKKMEDVFGDRLVYRKDVIRSTGTRSVHHGMKGDNYKKGEDVLVDCLLLSKCNFLFKGISNVAVCTLFFNENLEHFNLNDYYNKDKRESFMKQNLSYV